MKIRIPIIVEVDPKEWANNNGLTSTKAADVREDLTSYILNHVQNLALVEESDATVTLGNPPTTT